MSSEDERDPLRDFLPDPSKLGDREHEVRAQLRAMRAAIEHEVQRREGQRHWRRPLPGPIPVVLNGVPELDPLTFTVELESPPSDRDLTALTDGIARIGEIVSADDVDHISFWSEAIADQSAETALPAVTWWFDAARASPATIQRLIEELQRLILSTELRPVRFLIGAHPPSRNE